MKEILNINGNRYELETVITLTTEQRNAVIKKLSGINTGCSSCGETKKITSLATGCPTSAIPVGTTKTFQCTASGGNGSYNYTLTIGSSVYNSPVGSPSTWNHSHTFNTVGTITPITLLVKDTCTGTTLSSTDSCPSGFIVQARALASMVVNGCTAAVGTIPPNNTCQLSVIGTDQFGTAFTPVGVTWSSSNISIATVNTSTGLVMGISDGTSTITATSAGITATKLVTVQAVCTTPSCSFTII